MDFQIVFRPPIDFFSICLHKCFSVCLNIKATLSIVTVLVFGSLFISYKQTLHNVL
jgi:hypothetical protein